MDAGEESDVWRRGLVSSSVCGGGIIIKHKNICPVKEYQFLLFSNNQKPIQMIVVSNVFMKYL